MQLGKAACGSALQPMQWAADTNLCKCNGFAKGQSRCHQRAGDFQTRVREERGVPALAKARAGIERSLIGLECRMCWKRPVSRTAGARPGRASGWPRTLDRFPGPPRATKRVRMSRSGWGAGDLLLHGRIPGVFPRSFHFPGDRRSLVLEPGKETEGDWVT